MQRQSVGEEEEEGQGGGCVCWRAWTWRESSVYAATIDLDHLELEVLDALLDRLLQHRDADEA
eukprot:2066203-Rhodomonas_salina.1